MNTRAIVELQDVSRTYEVANGLVAALDSVSVSVRPGEFIVVLGPSSTSFGNYSRQEREQNVSKIANGYPRLLRSCSPVGAVTTSSPPETP